MPDSDLSTPLILFEPRFYRTRPGRRDELIAMFEAHFRPAYEAAGATILACHAALQRQTWPRGARHWRLMSTACSLQR
jgi:hypothetical protein